MSVIADISIPAEQFALGDVLEVRSGVEVRLESMIPTGEAVIPYFWVKNTDAEAVGRALRESDIVEEVRIVDEANEETLFRVQWSEEVNGVIDAIKDTHAVVLEGNGRGDYWSFQLRFPEYDSLSTFYRSLVEKDVSVEVEGIHNPVDSPQSAEFGLTPEQFEALSKALEAGYFTVPRQITLVELAEELGISDSAVSQRIRRGLARILTTTIAGDSNQRTADS